MAIIPIDSFLVKCYHSGMDKELIKQVVLEQRAQRKVETLGVERHRLSEIETVIPLSHAIIIAGVRRTGKSTLLRQILHKYYGNDLYYIDFEDERLLNFTAQDFNLLYEVFIELYGLKNLFFLDEIQNIEGWEMFVRRMHRENNKIFITGSNAFLLSSEMATKLTGRHVLIELLPFSFQEYLSYHKIPYTKESFLITQERSIIKRAFNEYLEHGGMPEYLEHKNPVVLQSVYENILYKDVIVRFDVKEVKALRELSLYLMSQVGSTISITNLKNMLNLGSVNTVKNYIHYLETAYLIFTLDRFSFSQSEQGMAQKKIYAVDNGLTRNVAFQFSENRGRYLENAVYLELRRRYKEIYYYRTKNNFEVDFLIREGTTIVALIQVTESLANEKTRARELRSLEEAMLELKVSKGIVLTYDETESLDSIEVIPLYKWLLSPSNIGELHASNSAIAP